MTHLLRRHAPITDKAWDEIDAEARERLTPALAARKLVDFVGPLGWEHSATNLGRVQAVEGEPVTGVQALQRRVLPLVELRAPFTVARDELRDIDRGAVDADFESLDAAAQRLAVAEKTLALADLCRVGSSWLAWQRSRPALCEPPEGATRRPWGRGIPLVPLLRILNQHE